jgi:hypothetical protein
MPRRNSGRPIRKSGKAGLSQHTARECPYFLRSTTNFATLNLQFLGGHQVPKSSYWKEGFISIL